MIMFHAQKSYKAFSTKSIYVDLLLEAGKMKYITQKSDSRSLIVSSPEVMRHESVLVLRKI